MHGSETQDAEQHLSTNPGFADNPFADIRFSEEIDGLRMPPTVLVANCDPPHANALARILRRENYRVLQAFDREEIHAALNETCVDLVVLNTSRSPAAAMRLCRDIQRIPGAAAVPIVLVSEEADLQEQMAAIFRQRFALNRMERTEQVLFTLAQTVEHRDRGTSRHCERLARMSVGLGQMLGLPPTDLMTLHRSGYP